MMHYWQLESTSTISQRLKSTDGEREICMSQNDKYHDNLGLHLCRRTWDLWRNKNKIKKPLLANIMADTRAYSIEIPYQYRYHSKRHSSKKCPPSPTIEIAIDKLVPPTTKFQGIPIIPRFSRRTNRLLPNLFNTGKKKKKQKNGD